MRPFASKPAAPTPGWASRGRRPAPTLLAGVSRVSGAVFVTLALIGASAWIDLRIQAFGLFIHPYLAAVALLFAVFAAPRIRRFPREARPALQFFVLFYAISTVPGGGALSEMLKVLAAVITAVALAVTLDHAYEFRAGVAGLNVAVFIMSLKGLAGEREHLMGYNPLDEIANKNAFSLYALPAILLAGHVILDRTASRRLRAALALAILPAIYTIVSGANRSGWLGLVVIAAMLFNGRGLGRKLQAALVVATIGVFTYVLLTEYGGTDIVEYRVERTLQGYSSDQERRHLLLAAFQVGLEHPLLGVSAQGLSRELAARLHTDMGDVDPHNIFGHLFGAGGILSLGTFLLFGYRLWRRPPSLRRAGASSPGRAAHDLVRMVILLFAVRGMFTREVLYSPGFAAALGLAIGLALVHGLWARRAPVAPRPPRGALWEQPGPAPDPSPEPVASPKLRPFTRGPWPP